MSYFRVMPDALRAQQEELEAAYRVLCGDVSEICGVIRRLQSMSCFDGPIETLRRVQRAGSEQQVKLRQCARVLGAAADLYARTERRNLEDGGQSDTVRTGAYQSFPVYPALLEPAEMLPEAERLYGMEVAVPQRK